MIFDDFHFSDSLRNSIGRQGFQTPTKIQEMAIPHVLDGKDVMGCAQTGTGKTAAFVLPLLQRMTNSERKPGKKRIRVLALAPTRELASQIEKSFYAFGSSMGFRSTVIFGGVGQYPQTRALNAGVDILVATPGRLLDLMNQGYIDLSSVEYLVLDEADRMLDMGFINDIRRFIAAIPKQRQTLLFSATLPQSILQLAKSILTEPVTINVTPKAATVESIDQSVFFVHRSNKIDLLLHLLDDSSMARALVFTKTKHGADKVVHKLNTASIAATAIHGNKSQNNREKALYDFKRGISRVLVATDIASRGLDIDQVTHVVNFDLPDEPECYVHRIGRTGRAGASGIALSFCAREERPLLSSIERLIHRRIEVQDRPQLSYLEQPEAKLDIPLPSKRPSSKFFRHGRRRSFSR